MVEELRNKLSELRYKYFPNWKTLKSKSYLWGGVGYQWTIYKIKYSSVRNEYKLVIDGKHDECNKVWKEMMHSLYYFKNKHKRSKLIEKSKRAASHSASIH